MSDFLYNAYQFEEIIPSIISLYNGMKETIQITIKIINEASLLTNYSEIIYINSYKPIHLIHYINQPFSDIKYWDHTINQMLICNSNYNNHLNWNSYSLSTTIKVVKSQLWMKLYPIINYNYLWSPESVGVLKVKFQGFIIPDILSENIFKHHDYCSKSMFSTNIYFNKNMNSINHYNYGFFLYWYEHYGAAEIGLKVLFTYWYELCYPEFEKMLLLTENSIPNFLTDKQYTNKLITDIIENLNLK